MAVSSAYNASCVLGGEACRNLKCKRVVDKTAPWGRPEEVV
jgi:hypothetical protein